MDTFNSLLGALGLYLNPGGSTKRAQSGGSAGGGLDGLFGLGASNGLQQLGGLGGGLQGADPFAGLRTATAHQVALEQQRLALQQMAALNENHPYHDPNGFRGVSDEFYRKMWAKMKREPGSVQFDDETEAYVRKLVTPARTKIRRLIERTDAGRREEQRNARWWNLRGRLRDAVVGKALRDKHIALTRRLDARLAKRDAILTPLFVAKVWLYSLLPGVSRFEAIREARREQSER